MEELMGNSKIYDRPEEKCPRCGIPLNVGLVFHNVPNNCKEYSTFPYMEICERMHMECYIERVMEKKWKQLKEEDYEK